MFNLINFCKFFANSKEIPENSRVSLGTARKPTADKIVFTILGQKIEMLLENGNWQPILPDLFEQQQQEQQEQQQEQQQAEFFCNLLKNDKILSFTTENGMHDMSIYRVMTIKERFDFVASNIIGESFSTRFPIKALIGGIMYKFYPKFTNDACIIPVCRINSDNSLNPVGIILNSEDVPYPMIPYTGYYFAPKTEQEEPMPAPKTEQEEPTSPIYRYFETREGSSIGVYKIGEDTIIGIVDKAGNLWSCRNLGKQGKKRVIYTIFGDDQQLNLKQLGSIHGAIIEARNFLQAAKKAKKPAKIEIKAAFLGHEAVKIAKIELINGSYNLTVFTSAGEEVVPKMPQKEEETTNKAELSPIEPVFNAKTASISEQLTKLRELQEQTTVILKNLQAKGMSLEQIKALLATN